MTAGRFPRKAHRGRQYKSIEELARGLNELEDHMDGLVSLGHPGDELNQGGVELPGDLSTSHPGVLLHIHGSWVRKSIEATDTPFTCWHNLDLAIITAGEPNVTWAVYGLRHDGTGVVAGDETVSVMFVVGDSVGANSIELRAYASGARTVDTDHPLDVTLRFQPSDRWP